MYVSDTRLLAEQLKYFFKSQLNNSNTSSNVKRNLDSQLIYATNSNQIIMLYVFMHM